MRIVVDSNIWIALLDFKDSQHEKARKLFETTKEGIIIVPEYVITEVCTVLKRNTDKETADLFIRLIHERPYISILSLGENLLMNVLQYFLQSQHAGLSFIDVSLLYLSQFYTVVTFDKKLASAIKKAGRR